MAAFFVSQEQFNLFHSIDRELYTHLVIDLWRDSVESMQVMGLWLWLERMGYRNVVKKMLSLPYALINELANEAVICLDCITKDHFAFTSESADIPLIQGVMEKEISLKFFHENRLIATQGVAKIVNDVCVRAFSDIMQQAVRRNAAQSLLDTQIMLSSFQPSVAQPRFPQTGLGPINTAQPSMQGNDLPADDRTMFVTFSKGYAVREWEVRDFFNRTYGDCIESLHMQEVEPHEQSLFARIVFRSSTTIEVILNGMDKAKFSINGKHVWARKFVPKRPKSSLPLLSLPNFSPSCGQ